MIGIEIERSGRMSALDRQAADLSSSTPYAFEAIRRLQRGLMSESPMEEGAALTEDETLEAVPVALRIHAATLAPVGRVLRIVKERGLAVGAVWWGTPTPSAVDLAAVAASFVRQDRITSSKPRVRYTARRSRRAAAVFPLAGLVSFFFRQRWRRWGTP